MESICTFYGVLVPMEQVRPLQLSLHHFLPRLSPSLQWFANCVNVCIICIHNCWLSIAARFNAPNENDALDTAVSNASTLFRIAPTTEATIDPFAEQQSQLDKFCCF